MSEQVEVDSSMITGEERRLSALLRQVTPGLDNRVSVAEIATALGDRSFSPMLILFAAPNVFLYLPGSSLFTSLPLVFIALQLISGRPVLWLPEFVSRLSIERNSYEKVVAFIAPQLERVERFAKPRSWPATGLIAERLAGVICLAMAILLFLPIPFANGIPALSILAIAIALSERDGNWLAAGTLVALLSIPWVGLIVGGGMAAMARIF